MEFRDWKSHWENAKYANTVQIFIYLNHIWTKMCNWSNPASSKQMSPVLQTNRHRRGSEIIYASTSFYGGPRVRRPALECAVRSLVYQFGNRTSSPQLPLNSFSSLSNSLREPRTFSWLSSLETTVILTSLSFEPQAGFWHSCFLIQLCNPSAEFNQHKLVGVRKYLGTFIQY